MEKYQNFKTLSHLESLIDDGGIRKKIINKGKKNNPPFFSVITVVKNSSDYIETTIKKKEFLFTPV